MKKTLIYAAAAALLPMAALAGEGKVHSGSMGPSFETLDANRDGRISQAEAAVDSSIVFSTADANGDGYLNKKELRTHQKSGRSSEPRTSEPRSQGMPDSAPNPDTETPRQ